MRSAAIGLVLVLAMAIESCGQGAQDPYKKGITALHNSAYDAAAEYFQAAEKLDPNFVLAYWGEAMSFNHPFQAEQDIAGGRRALGKLGASRAARASRAKTQREKDYLNAAEILYGDGDKDTRDAGFANAMVKLSADYPDDVDAAAFSAMALLGTLRYGDKTFATQTKAAAVAKKVLAKYPDHPGALHYLIHSNDDPQHAHLALDAARKYERIADPNSHALHMPSHIYVQLGLWPDVARANQTAFDVSDRYVRSKGLPLWQRDYHSFEWLMYAELQMGQYAKAHERPDLILQTARNGGPSGMTGYAATVASRFAVETRDWDFLTSAGYPVQTRTPELAFAQGMSAIAKGNKTTALMEISTLDSLAKSAAAAGKRVDTAKFTAMSKELSAQLAVSEKRWADAEKFAVESLQYESTFEFPSGPPDLLKPAYELYGEILLAAGKPKEAAAQFATSLKRMPNRALSLLGLARAREMQKDTAGANQAYRELAQMWAGADPKVRSLLPAGKE